MIQDKKKCKTCQYFEMVYEVGDEEGYGRCHRYPRVLIAKNPEFVSIDDWCGEHKQP